MIEITAYNQLLRLKASTLMELQEQLNHLCLNRGGLVLKNQAGYFLYSFNPKREKILSLISDFLFLSMESLQKKQEDLLGYNLIFESLENQDEVSAFSRLKNLLFQSEIDKAVWAGPSVVPEIRTDFPLKSGTLLYQILGPQHKKLVKPLSYLDFLSLTGWPRALKGPLEKRINSASGRVLRINGDFFEEKIQVLLQVLQNLYPEYIEKAGTLGIEFPVLYPLKESRDVLSQLLDQINILLLPQIPLYLNLEEKRNWENESHWEFLLRTQGGGDYPGDNSSTDVSLALKFYFIAQIRLLVKNGFPPVFIFISPQEFELEAVQILENVLAQLVRSEGLQIIIFEHNNGNKEFLTGLSCTSWTFPVFNWPVVKQEQKLLGWSERFQLPISSLNFTRGAGLAHLLWGIQEGFFTQNETSIDPSKTLLLKLDLLHQKVYCAFILGRPLLKENELIDFFQYLGEDPAVVKDKLDNLIHLGFIVYGNKNLALRPDLLDDLLNNLGEEGKFVVKSYGLFLFKHWKLSARKLSEVVFEVLLRGEHYKEALEVLDYYITFKINRGQADYSHLLKHCEASLVNSEYGRKLNVLTRAYELRFLLNQDSTTQVNLDKLEFKDEETIHIATNTPEWLLQTGRLNLATAQVNEGFNLVKTALLSSQEIDNSFLEIRSEIEIGQALLMRHKLEEGQEYFEMAFSKAEKTNSYYGMVWAGSLDVSTRFLMGHLTGVKELLDRLEPLTITTGMQNHRVMLGFLRARNDFVLGNYHEAAQILDNLQNICKNYNLAMAAGLCQLWQARCFAHTQDYEEAQKLMENANANANKYEKVLFQTELFLLAGNFAHALEILESISFPKTCFKYSGERVDWVSGFSFIEDRLWEQSEESGILSFLFRALKAYLLFKNGKRAESLRLFDAILEKKSYLETDTPYAMLYYWYYEALEPDLKNSEAQRLTLLGRSLNALQTRASRIENPQDRQKFLNRPLWNAKILAEARRSKFL